MRTCAKVTNSSTANRAARLKPTASCNLHRVILLASCPASKEIAACCCAHRLYRLCHCRWRYQLQEPASFRAMKFRRWDAHYGVLKIDRPVGEHYFIDPNDVGPAFRIPSGGAVVESDSYPIAGHAIDSLQFRIFLERCVPQ